MKVYEDEKADRFGNIRIMLKNVPLYIMQTTKSIMYHWKI